MDVGWEWGPHLGLELNPCQCPVEKVLTGIGPQWRGCRKAHGSINPEDELLGNSKQTGGTMEAVDFGYLGRLCGTAKLSSTNRKVVAPIPGQNDHMDKLIPCSGATIYVLPKNCLKSMT